MRNLIFLLALGIAFAQPPGIEGDWHGTLNTGAVQVRLGLHITKTSTGEYTSTLDSIDQAQMGLPITRTSFSGRTLHFEFLAAHIEFDGTLAADGSRIDGTFTQGVQLPLTFTRGNATEPVKRTQKPQAPFPYDSVDVSYQNMAGGVTLAGTLTFPRGGGPLPAAILITGSGPQDRDETILGHKPFLVIADYLARRGIAVLRLDDRGVGKSTGNSRRATIDDMAADVLAGVGFLKSRKEIDARHIGVIGHSEGGLVGPLAASRSADIAFVVMLAGPGVTLEQILYKQGELIRRSAGAGDQADAQARAVQEMVIGILKSEPDEKAAGEKIRAGWKKMKSSRPEGERTQMDALDALIEQQGAAFNVPEMRSMLTYDPAVALRCLEVPVLALNGSRDLQVSPEQNLPAIVSALSAGGKSEFTVTELPGLNHLFQKCTECTVAEYGKIPETFSPVALRILGDWLVQHTR
ncbi:MAG: alpha/beta fold hydrolase [Acidobacteriota bacterium]|nr:alpha/beta fold hydrolase [Acidobacteriota bacterium]